MGTARDNESRFVKKRGKEKGQSLWCVRILGRAFYSLQKLRPGKQEHVANEAPHSAEVSCRRVLSIRSVY